MQAERGGIVTGWLLKLVIWLAVAGFLLFEVGAMVVASVAADNAARAAATEAVDTYAHGHDFDAAQKAAITKAGEEGAEMVSFTADANGAGGQSRAVVVVRRHAKTLFLHRFSFLRRFTEPTASATAYRT